MKWAMSFTLNSLIAENGCLLAELLRLYKQNESAMTGVPLYVLTTTPFTIHDSPLYSNFPIPSKLICDDSVPLIVHIHFELLTHNLKAVLGDVENKHWNVDADSIFLTIVVIVFDVDIRTGTCIHAFPSPTSHRVFPTSTSEQMSMGSSLMNGTSAGWA